MANTSCKNHSHVGTPNNPAPSVIIVGGGLGGISTAVSLKRGFQVTVVEKNSHIGGRLNTLVKDGFSFDLGPSLTIMPHVFEELFERAGRNVYDYVPFVELNPQWRNFFEDKTRFDLTADFRTQEAELEKIGGAPGYYDYLEYSKRLYSFADKAYFENAADSVWDIIKHEKLKEIWEGTDFLSTMVKGVERYVKNPYLQDVLGFFIKYVGSSSVDAPAILNLLLYSQIGFGLWYIDGGMMNLAKGIEKLMDEMEITVLKETRVRSFIKQGRKVKGVTLEGGKTLMGDLVVSNVEVIPTYRDLMDEPAGHLKKLEKFGPACSGLVVHLGVDKVYPELAHHNFFFSHNTKEHFNDVFHKGILPEDPTTYVVCPTVTDPTLAPKGSSVIKVLPHIPPCPSTAKTPTTTTPTWSGCSSSSNAWGSKISASTSWFRTTLPPRISKISTRATAGRSTGW